MKLQSSAPVRGGRVFYGWIIVGVSFFTMGLAYVPWHTFSVFFVALLEGFSWSRGETALAFTISSVVYGSTSPITGALLDRFGPRMVMPFGALLIAIGFIAASRLDSLWQLYLFYGVIASVGMNLTGTLPCMTVVQRWFLRQRGMAIGIVAGGTGISMVALIPFTQYLISTIGWRSAYLALAGVMVAVLGPLSVLFQRSSPADMGLQPDGSPTEGRGSDDRALAERLIVDQAWAARPWTAGSAMRTRRFWLLALAFTCAPLASQAVLVHGIAYLTDIGYDKMSAAVAFGSVGVLSMFFRVIWGYLSDRIGRELCWLIACLGVSASIATLMGIKLVGWDGLLWVFAMEFGIAYSAGSQLFAAMAADVFEGRSFGSIFGLLYAGIGIGSGIGPLLAGTLYDVTGSYYLAFGACIASIGISALSVWLAAPGKVRMVPGKLRVERV